MKWFKKKKKEPEYVFSKTVPYKGYNIFIYCKKRENEMCSWLDNYALFGFETGWRAADYGQYNTGVSGEGLSENIQSHIESAKKYIDKVVSLPDDLKKAIEVLNNIDLK